MDRFSLVNRIGKITFESLFTRLLVKKDEGNRAHA